ncbi:MXAN_6577-like cysteine-rich protein [Sandaracinus amylolyticus]|uniref:MXAN_6577-like cysteine-rich protein n=1 Tax=Sandaracinus amylolyticus TaxID=927083 RepID=UPI001F1DC86B|nr:MXAN_6577-like cysteine-rich protein [Sandaracinus amylolyticus]UJR84356.1 Hypothetical protein I5071_64350 [Sandaracinus amylolyticus]
MIRAFAPGLALFVLVVGSSGCTDDTRPAGPRVIPPPDAGGALDGSASCTGGATSCGGQCVDLASDFSNCGACGNACNADEVCSGSRCLTGGCPSGTTSCGGSCVDTERSATHCGECGNTCVGGSSCMAGECTCGGGLELCDGSCVDTSTDTAHCGGCGNACGAGERCEGGSCVACGGDVSFARDVQPIFTASCVDGCHGSNRPSADLELTSGRAYGELVDVASTCTDARPLVAPGDPEGSALYQKLVGTACSGQRMPLGRGDLPAAQIALVRDWICAGAQND